jgi:competence protein ComEC
MPFNATIEKYASETGFVALCVGIFLAKMVQPGADSTWRFFVWGLSLALLWAGLRRRRRNIIAFALLLLLAATGFNIAAKELAVGRDYKPPPEKILVEAVVVTTASSGPGFRTLLVEDGMNASSGASLPGLGRLTLAKNSTVLFPGDRIAFRSLLKKPRNRNNPGEYDWEAHCKNDRVEWLAYVQGEDAAILIRRGWAYSPAALIARIRLAMNVFIESSSTGDARALLKGIVTGDRGEIDPGLNRAYSDSGLAHILSASGLHVAIVALLLIQLVKAAVRAVPWMLLRCPFSKLAAMAFIPTSVFYCLLVGARAPAVRSTIMGLVFAAAVLIDRRWYSLNTLALAGILILLVYPMSLFAAEFQLSFAAVFGILTLVPRCLDALFSPSLPKGMAALRLLRRRTRRGSDGLNASTDRRPGYPTIVWHSLYPAVAMLLTTVASTTAIFPFLAVSFHSFPLYSVAANLVAWPLLAVGLPLAVLASMIGIVLPGPGQWILWCSSVPLELINDTARFFAGLPGSALLIPGGGAALFVAGAALVLSFFWLTTRLSGPAICWALCSLPLVMGTLIGFSWIVAHDDAKLRVFFLNVGNADAAFVKPPGARGLLIDGGARNEYSDAGSGIVAPFFKWAGVWRLEGMLISHPEMDHMGGLLTAAELAPPDRLWWNPVDPRPRFLDRIISTAALSGASVHKADRGCAAVKIGDATMTFLNPGLGSIPSGRRVKGTNNASVVCRLDFGATSFLFPGDIETQAEDELLSAGVPLRATVLKAAHHGGKTSSSQRFLEAVRPRLVVVSCDDQPGGRRPNSTALARLEAIGAKILLTGRDGAITVESDGEQIRVKTGLSGRWTLVAD